MEENSTVPKQNKLHALAFLEVGIFEFVFVAIVLFLLFGVLNYFNILPVSDAFPKYLSWLPKQTKIILQGNALRTKKIVPLSTPTPIPEYIRNDAKSLISDILMPYLVPNNLVIEKQNVKNPNNFTFYGTGWENINKETFVLSVEYNQEENIVDRQIVIHIPKIFSDLNPSSSSSLIKNYLTINPPFSFSCIPLPTTAKSTFCEIFWEDTQGIKKGIDITSPVQGLQETQLLYCEHHKETPAYLWKSCNANYKDIGM